MKNVSLKSLKPIQATYSRLCEGASLPLLLVAVLTICVGCRPTPQTPIVPARSKDAPSFSSGSEDHLRLAMEFIDSLNEFSEVEIVSRIDHHLSKWIKESEPDDDWVADPLFGRLPDRLRLAKGRAALSRLVFRNSDVGSLREAMWLRNIAQRHAAFEVSDVALAGWLASNEESLGPEAIRDIGAAFELFDWVVRNIQLEKSAKTEDGIPYTKRMAWESLLLGRGDEYVRSRLFILLARQQGIPVVMLAIDTDDEAQPWLPAALIKGQLYLFDMRLGVPVSKETQAGIATLADVIEHPSCLEGMGADYRVSVDDLKRIVAYIDATPEYLSQRMRLIESALTAKDKMKLTCRPSVLSKELRESPGITNVALWPLPYDSIQARLALRENPQELIAIQLETNKLSGQSAISRGRRQHFRGKFADTPTLLGAKNFYMQSRMSDAQIDSLSKNEAEVKMLLEMQRFEDTPEARAAVVGSLQTRMREAKEQASLWLGLLAFEKEQYQVAANFFAKRTIAAFPEGELKPSAIYNLGRTYERWGKGDGESEPDKALLTQAIDAYESIGDTPEAAACRLRAKRLAATVGE